MAMQRFHIIKETHNKPITAICYNPMKHEVVAGCEDGTIKTWECVGDNIGKLSRVSHEHTGIINCFLYWSDGKILLSAGNDGQLIGWGSTMLPLTVNRISMPVYSMAWNARRKQLILGVNGALRVYHLLDTVKDGKIFNESDKVFVAKDHSDIVKGIVCHETRVYSAGFDRKLCIYDSYSYPGKKGLHLISCMYPAHDAGISTLILARDNESNTWLISGGFDKTVKIWSQDGQIMHKFDGFSETVTGICYVSPTKTVWVAAGTPDAPMYDPKSGDNVSEFIGTFQNKEQETERYSLVLLTFVPDLNQIIATDSRRKIHTWKYNPTGCITALKHKHAVECLTFTHKVPILLFSGDGAGQITKWERLQSNTFMYSKEMLPRSEAVAQLAAQIARKYDWAVTDKRQIREQLQRKKNDINSLTPSTAVQSNVAAMKLIFVEELDLLLIASEDNNIYVWGFDYEAVKVLQQMQPADDHLLKKFAFLLDTTTNDAAEEDKTEMDSVTNRVAGFVCKTVFTEHTQCVSGLAVVNKHGKYETTYLLSAGWDRRIYIWNLDDMCLHDNFRNHDPENRFEEEEIAADGIIIDLAYCEERNEFAYSSSDKLVYIRSFDEDGSKMNLRAVLHGHEAEVSQIKWNSVHSKWISGSEDGTIRVWSADGLTCDMILSSHGNVSAMCIDSCNGCIVAGVEDIIRVYDIGVKTIVQTNIGHTDAIRSLIHIPERGEYISASWDKTVRVWNAFKRSKRHNSSS